MKKIVIILSLITMATYSCKKEKNSSNDSSKDIVKNKDTTTVRDLVKIETDSGNMIIWLYDNTPLHKHNFDSLTRAGYYNNLKFHRVIDNFMIQTGDHTGTGKGGQSYSIKAEIYSKHKHIKGAIGAARKGDKLNPEKKSSGSQFYIVEKTGGTPHLDGAYTVFGQTISGLDVISAIASVKTKSNIPVTDIKMNSVKIVKYSDKQLLDSFNYTIPK